MSEVQRECIELASREGLPLRVDRYRDRDRSPRGGVIVCHGFKGFKRWGFFPHLSRELAAAGYEVLTFDFSRNGIGEDAEEFGRLDLFADNCYSRELDDLAVVRDWAESLGAPWDQGIGLLGHSRAAVPVMVEARENPRIRAVVTWSGVGRLLRFTPRQLAAWEQEGRMEFTNARTGQRMAMSYGFVEDVHAHAERLDLARAASEMRAAHLIVHGTADLAVPCDEARLLQAGRSERCELFLVEGASHTYGAKHPFEGPPPTLRTAVERSIEWFDAYLAGPSQANS